MGRRRKPVVEEVVLASDPVPVIGKDEVRAFSEDVVRAISGVEASYGRDEDWLDEPWMPPHVDVDKMTKQECYGFGAKHFAVRLDNSKLVHEMRNDVRQLLSSKQQYRYR